MLQALRQQAAQPLTSTLSTDSLCRGLRVSGTILLSAVIISLKNHHKKYKLQKRRKRKRLLCRFTDMRQNSAMRVVTFALLGLLVMPALNGHGGPGGQVPAMKSDWVGGDDNHHWFSQWYSPINIQVRHCPRRGPCPE